jgi:hypothetical protein
LSPGLPRAPLSDYFSLLLASDFGVKVDEDFLPQRQVDALLCDRIAPPGRQFDAIVHLRVAVLIKKKETFYIFANLAPYPMKLVECAGFVSLAG